MNSIRHYYKNLQQIESNKIEVRTKLNETHTKLKQYEDKWHKQFDNYCKELANHIHNYLKNTSRNLFFDFETREWCFIEPLGIFSVGDQKPSYVNACVVCKIGDIKNSGVKAYIKKFNTPTRFYNNPALFHQLFPANHKIISVEHLNFGKGIRKDIRNFIQRNQKSFKNIIETQSTRDLSSIIETEIREMLANNLVK